MRVDLDPEIAEFIQQRVDDGRYADATAVMREAFHVLKEREKHQYVREALAETIAKADQGDEVDWSPDLLERLAQEADEMDRRGVRPHPDVLP
jgi:putative addiction module CopG family antidote